jgi:hypothetical protein
MAEVEYADVTRQGLALRCLRCHEAGGVSRAARVCGDCVAELVDADVVEAQFRTTPFRAQLELEERQREWVTEYRRELERKLPTW